VSDIALQEGQRQKSETGKLPAIYSAFPVRVGAFASVFYDMSVESTERSRDESRIDEE